VFRVQSGTFHGFQGDLKGHEMLPRKVAGCELRVQSGFLKVSACHERT
jgi:hypothetical protein